MTLKKLIKNSLLLYTIAIFAYSSLCAQDKGAGIGVMLGEPTGFSGKYWLSQNNALDFGLAYSFINPSKAFSLHADYLFHGKSIFPDYNYFSTYYGFGGRIHFGNSEKSVLGARGVIGILWMDKAAPLDIFLEIAPVFNLFPETSLHLDCAIGARVYF